MWFELLAQRAAVTNIEAFVCAVPSACIAVHYTACTVDTYSDLLELLKVQLHS
jgi:hypothetical protein